nr:retrovirus-related Pol polyprotein from transposon TNT 1-94 [Tanacetum cinerariifolium]
MRVASINGNKYIMVIVDDYSRYTWTLFLRSKDETPEVLKDVLTMIQINLQALVITVRTDRGTEFLNKTLNAFFKEEGIEHQTSSARTPEQNGIVKKRNRTMVEAARTMLSALQLPLFFWAEAIATACYTQNRSIIIPTHEKTPYSIINDRKPSIKHLYIFGCICYITRDGENLDKMKEKGDQCILVGYSTQSKGYRVYNKRTRIIVESIHIRFDDIKEVSETSVANNTPGLTRDHPLEQVRGNSSRPVQTRRQLATDPKMCMVALTVSTAESKNIKEAMANSAWIEAMQEELHQFDRLHVWELVNKPFDKSIIRLKWLWKNKKDEDQTMDVKMAFLNGPLKEEVYVAQSDGFVDPDHPEKVYRLRKALYGLKQALKAWYDELSKFLISKGFTKGLQIHQSPRGIFINQAKYTLEILHKHGMDKGQSIGDKLVSWMSKKQNCAAMSSAEAEYVALSASCSQVMWMRTQLQEYGFNYNKIPLYCDSQSAIASHATPYSTPVPSTSILALPEDRFKYLVRKSYALSWKPCQGDSLNPPVHRALVTKSHNKTPYELLNGRTPRLDFMRPFGCPVTILNTLDPLGKFEGKANEEFFVGYYVTSKAFRVFNTKTRQVKENLHVRFLENKPNVAGTGPKWLFDIDSLTNSMNYIPLSAGNQTDKNVGPQDTNGNAADALRKESGQGCMDQSRTNQAGSTNLVNIVSNLVNAASTLGTFGAGGPSSHNLDAFFPAHTLLHIDQDDSQIPNLEDTAELQSTVMNKARLVAQGHRQEERIDYDEVFAPMARIEAIKIFLAFASFMGFIVYQMDVKSAFLYGINRRGGDKDDIMLVQVYVDDIIFGSTKKSLCDEFEALMHKRFQMSSMRELTFFLEMQVKQSKEGIFIRKDKYVAKILKRPDIMFAFCDCSRFQVTPKLSHLHTVKRIFRRLISWQCKKQTIVVTSTTEAEYIAAANCFQKSMLLSLVSDACTDLAMILMISIGFLLIKDKKSRALMNLLGDQEFFMDEMEALKLLTQETQLQ